jgi:anti-anti-sigma factor
MAINVTESNDGKEVTIRVSGRFDFSLHQTFIDSYQNYPKGEKQFVVDLEGTEYMDSSAMGMLLQLREHAAQDAGRIKLINANDTVRKILGIANFNKLFDIV